MDPQICQQDIVKREEASEERLRMTDPQCISVHLNISSQVWPSTTKFEGPGSETFDFLS